MVGWLHAMKAAEHYCCSCSCGWKFCMKKKPLRKLTRQFINTNHLPPNTWLLPAVVVEFLHLSLADLGGREGRTPPPGRPNSFDFMQFSGKFGVFTPPLEGSRPPPRENPGSATAFP